MIIVPWPFSFPPKTLKDIFEQCGYFLPCDCNINKKGLQNVKYSFMKKWCVSKEFNGQFCVLTCVTKCLVMESKTKNLVTKCRKGKRI